MKIINPQLSGSVYASGSFVLPSGRADQRPTSPPSGSLFFEISDSGSNLVVYNGSGSNGWEIVGKQTTPSTPVVLSTDIEYLLVAGGGSGGSDYGGGGGAGGYLSSSLASVTSGSSFTVTVGAGGASVTGGNNDGNNGVDSSIAGASISTITATGGGGGGAEGALTGKDGGSGGGGAFSGTNAGAGGSGTVGQGNDGGDGQGSGGQYLEGGGGGAGTPGEDAVANTSNGAGGDGLASSITGTSVTRAGGGGAGYSSDYNKAGAAGGTGGGGAGGTTIAGNGTAGTANTGGGGGGAGGYNTTANSGIGGSGVAIFAYESGSFNCAGGIVGDAGNGRKYNQFNQSGTFKVGNTTTDFQVDTTNLVGWWDAGDYSSRGDSTWTDKMGNYNLTKGGTPTLGNDYYYTMQANGEYYNTNLTVTSGAKSMVLWIKYTGGGGAGYSLTGWQENGAYCYLGRQDSNGKYYYYIGNSTGGEAATAPTLNTWYMLTLTNNASGNYEFYENDGSTVIVSGTGISMGSNGTSRFNIGSVNNTGSHRNHAQIGMCFYYTKYLSSSDVNALYNATKTNFV